MEIDFDFGLTFSPLSFSARGGWETAVLNLSISHEKYKKDGRMEERELF